MVPWLRIILRSPSVVEEFYEPWAYVLQPGKPNANNHHTARQIMSFAFQIRFRRHLENSRTVINRRVSVTRRPVNSLAAQHFRRVLNPFYRSSP